MGKVKPVKKSAQSPLKISTSLFQRKSKTSQSAGLIDRGSSSNASAKKGTKGAKATTSSSSANKAKPAKGKKESSSATGGKSSSKASKTSKDVNSTASSKKPAKQQKYPVGKKKQEKVTPSPAVEKKAGKKEKATSVSTKKDKVVANKASKNAVKAGPTKGKIVKRKVVTSSSSASSSFSTSASSSSASSSSSSSEGERYTRATSNSKKKLVMKRGMPRRSRDDKSPSPATRRRSPESEKMATRKRSKSDSESPPPQKVAKVGEKKGNVKKSSVAKFSATKDVAKKVAKKAVSIVASKKKTVVKKVVKPAPATKSVNKAKEITNKDNKKKSKEVTKSKPVKIMKAKPKAKPKTKIKLKRMASLNAKAILEASFSFEPSEKKQRSPAPSTSSQKSKSTTSTSTSTTTEESSSKGASTSELKFSSGTSTSKGTEARATKVTAVSVSTSTSPTPPEIPEPPPTISPKTFKSNAVPAKGEKKRKSTDASSSTSTSRRESTSSTKSGSRDTQTATSNSLISVGTSTIVVPASPVKKEKSTSEKAASRRSSASGSSSATVSVATDAFLTSAGKGKEKSPKCSNAKKKQKMVAGATTATTTSTSTSTSPIPMWNEVDASVEKRVAAHGTTAVASVPKQKKHRVGSGSGRDKIQDSSSQVEGGQLSHHHSSNSSKLQKGAGYQVREKSSTPVALYGSSGTVYQPAGPLIEPHKQSSVPAGILPETVRLPPDLKVSYHTHPPSSGYMVSSPETQQPPHHHQSKASSSSSKSHKSSSSTSTSTHKSEKSSSSAGTILHQPYKTTASSASSPALSRNVPSTYSSTGSGYASSTGTPLLSPSDVTISHHQHPAQSAAAAASSGTSLQGSQHGSSGSGSLPMSTHHHPLHSVTPGGSITVGGSSQQSQNTGAPSSSGLYYATNYGPHHSPFAPSKYPIVPPDSYRTPSPFPSSFLCPPTTPQASQSYFMTPFYTPPLTPNPTPGIGTVGPNQPRPLPLSSAVGHHPTAAAAAAAAAAAYYQHQSGPISQLPPPPSAYAYMASPQHSIHPTPAPGHAGPFRPNQSSQPACPYPTESYPPSSNCTNSNIRPPPLRQPPSLSRGSLPAPEAGAKPKPKQTISPASVSVTASKPSRTNREVHLQHPPTCITPAEAADPPTSIQIIPNITITADAQQVDARMHLESAKTFNTAQYSLPDDITITPIIPPNAIANNALLMLNSSVSVILTSAPTSTTTTLTSTASKSTNSNNNHDGLLKLNNSCNHLPSKPKEKDIVHVIDPRSGQRTTIAKHMSNNSRIAGSLNDNSNKNKMAHISGKGSMTIGLVNNKSKAMNSVTSHSRMETVRKLNPDLDVIVINSGDAHRNDKIENIQTMNMSPATNLPEKRNHSQGQQQKSMPPLKPGRVIPNKAHQPVPFSAISSSVMGLASGSSTYYQQQQQQGKRVALSHNDNNFHRAGNGNNNSLLRESQKKSKAAGSMMMNAAANNNFQAPYPRNTNSNPRNAPRSSNGSPASGYQTYPMPMPTLPPGISISPGNGNAHDNTQPTNLSKKSCGNALDYSKSGQFNQPAGNQQKVKAIKRSLNECIDGLQLQHQQKKLKLLEQQHAMASNSNNNNFGRPAVMGNGSLSASPAMASTSARTAIYNVNGGKSVYGAGSVPTNQQQIYQQHFRSPQHFPVMGFNKGRTPLQIPVYGKETATAARVRDPDYEQRLGGMLINSTDAVTAVSALVVEPFDYSMINRQLANQSNGLSRKGKEKAIKFPSAIASYAFAEAKAKANKLKVKQGVEKASTRGAGGAKSKIRTRLSVKPKGLNNTQQPLGSRSRSRLLRKRSLLCNPNTNNNSNSRKSESDGSVCASRSSSSVRIISGATGQANGKAKDREKEKPRNTQAFINAAADLYQYRRSVILRVPSPKPFALLQKTDGDTATAVANLNRTAGAEAIARFGDVSPATDALGGDRGKANDIPREMAAHQMAQLARTHIMANQPVSQPSLPQEAIKGPGPVFNLPRTGSMVVNAMKKRAGLKPLSPASVNGALSQQLLLNSKSKQPRWSNGWTFEGEPYEAKVFVKNDDTPITRTCYPSMRHDGGDVIRTRDCVLLKSGPRKNDLPFIAKIAALWENPTDGEMMFSLLWYYRPEHTELGRTKDDMIDEIFASKHRDYNSVATIEDRCYVLTFNEYCRYRKRLKQLEQGIPDSKLIPFADSAMVNTNAAAKIAEAVWNGISAPADPAKNMTIGKVSPEVVFFCRKVYDFRQKRILKNPS